MVGAYHRQVVRRSLEHVERTFELQVVLGIGNYVEQTCGLQVLDRDDGQTEQPFGLQVVLGHAEQSSGLQVVVGIHDHDRVERPRGPQAVQGIGDERDSSVQLDRCEDLLLG